MRINVYSQELITDDACIDTVQQREAGTGRIYDAVRLYLHSSERLHHTPDDDDRSAITFWLPSSPERRERVAEMFEGLALQIRNL